MNGEEIQNDRKKINVDFSAERNLTIAKLPQLTQNGNTTTFAGTFVKLCWS